MKIDTLAPSLFPDVLSHAGETYCALLEVGTGLIVLRWPDGHPERDVIIWIDSKATTHGFARLTQFNGDVFVAYRRDLPAPEHVVAVDLMTGTVSDWSVPCWGMHPLSWGMGGMLAVTHDTDPSNQHSPKRVLVAHWPDRPRESPLSRDASQAPTGISRITGQRVIFWHEETQEPLFQNRVWTPDITGSVGVTSDDRVIVDVLGVRGQVLSGHAYKSPRIAREGNGAYTVASHREGSHGPTGVEIVTGITQADLVMPPEPIEVAPYGRPVPFIVDYAFDAGRGYGNHPEAVLHAAICETQQDVTEANQSNTYVVTGRGLIGLAVKKAAVLISNDYQGAPPLQHQIAHTVPTCLAVGCGLIYYNERHEVLSYVPDWAIEAVRCFIEPNQTTQQWVAATRLKVSGAKAARVCLIVGVDDRLGQLSDAQLADGARQVPSLIREMPRIAIVRVFSFGRKGQLANGQPTGGAILRPHVWQIVTASADASDPIDWTDYAAPEDPIDPEDPDPEPEELDMPYVNLATQKPNEPVIVLVKVTEETKDGKLFLNKPDGRKLTMTPEGKIEDRNHDSYGAWEEWIKTGKGYVAERDNKAFGIVAL